MRFFGEGDGGEGRGERLFDFAEDEDELVASFWAEYSIDLTTIGYLPWRTFTALLSGLGPDSALGRKIALRLADPKDYAKKSQGRIRKAKARVALPEPDEPAADEAFEREWGTL
jgi:hypothetical protein